MDFDGSHVAVPPLTPLQSSSSIAMDEEPSPPSPHLYNEILDSAHVEEAEGFGAQLRACKTDISRLQLCREKRDELLRRYTSVGLEFAAFDHIMSTECQEYRRIRGQGRPKSMDEEYEAEWECFIGIVEVSSKALSDCMTALKPVIKNWGWEVVKYYGWVYSGLKRCKALRATSNTIKDWSEVMVKAPQIQLRRTQLPRGRSIRSAIDPLELTDLADLKNWNHKNSFVMLRDPEKRVLPFRKLVHGEIPPGYRLDRFGLLAREKFVTQDQDTIMDVTTSESQDIDRNTESDPVEDGVGEAIQYLDQRGDTVGGQTWSKEAGAALTSGSSISNETSSGPQHESGLHTTARPCETHTSSGRRESHRTESVEEPRKTLEPQLEGEEATEEPSDNAEPEEQVHVPDYPSPSASEAEAEDPTPRRSHRRPDQPFYKEAAVRNSRTLRSAQTHQTSRKASKACCPKDIPPELLSTLDGDSVHSVYEHASIARRHNHLPHRLCHRHLLAYAQLVSTVTFLPDENRTSLARQAVVDHAASVSAAPRRRSASMCEVTDMPSQKRHKLDEFDGETLRSGGRMDAVRDIGNSETGVVNRRPDSLNSAAGIWRSFTQAGSSDAHSDSVLHDFLDKPPPSMRRITEAFKVAIGRAGGLSDLRSNHSLDQPMIFPASECWKDRPTKDQYLTYLLDNFKQGHSLVYLRSRPNEPLSDAPIGTVVRQMFQPDPDNTCYAMNLSHEKANMRLPAAISTRFNVYNPSRLATSVNITPKYTHVDLHMDSGHNLVNAWCDKLWALCPPVEKNVQLYEREIASNDKFVLLAPELEDMVVVHTTEDEALWVPDGWLHATATITSGLTPGLIFNSSESLKNSATLLELDFRTCEIIDEASLTPLLQSIIVSLCSADKLEAQEQLCRWYALCSSQKAFPAFEEVKELIGPKCLVCKRGWAQHRLPSV